jgi:hypothetical protein
MTSGMRNMGISRMRNTALVGCAMSDTMPEVSHKGCYYEEYQSSQKAGYE